MLYTAAILTYRLPIGTAAIGGALFFTFVQKGKVRVPPPLVLLLVLSAWLLWICITGSPYAPWSLELMMSGWPKLLVIFFVALNVIRNRPQARLFLKFLLALFLAFPVRGAIINWLSGYAPGGRALWNGEFANPNGLAAMCVLQMGIAGGLVVTEPRKSPAWFLGVIGVLVLPMMIIMTASRGGFIALAVFGLLFLLASRQKGRAIVIVTIALLIGFLFAPESALRRFGGIKHLSNTSELGQADPEGSATERYALWAVGVQIIQDHPMYGVGPYAAPWAVRDYWPKAGIKDLHSVYLTVLAESGPPGLVLYLGIIGLVLNKSRKVRHLARQIEPRTEWQLRCLEISLFAFLVTAVWGAQPYLILFFLQLALMWSVADVTERSLVAMIRAQRQDHAPSPQLGPNGPFQIPVLVETMEPERR
jgi:O-antigen ligase